MYEYLMLLTLKLQTLIKKLYKYAQLFIIILVRKIYEKRCKIKTMNIKNV